MGTIFSSVYTYIYTESENEGSWSDKDPTTQDHPSTLDRQLDSNSPTWDVEELKSVDKMTIPVRCTGQKIMEVEVFPLERIRTLLESACEKAGKNPNKMQLVYEDILDETKTVQDYNLCSRRPVSLINKYT